MKTIKLATVGVLFMSTTILGGNVFAAEVGTRSTDAQVIFEESTDPVDPVDPINPEKPVGPVDPIDPEKPIDPGTNGPLSLDFASSLNFGKQKIVSTDKEYFAQVQTVKDKDGKNERTVPLYAQVTDNRGTNKGWSLSVKQNGQFKSDEDVLNGAKIEFLNGEIATISESVKPSFTKANFDLTADGTGSTANIMSAQDGEGSGTYVYRFGNDTSKAESVKLSVPGKTLKKKNISYTTSLTWSLNDVPGKI